MRLFIFAWLVQLFVACQAPVATVPKDPGEGPESVQRVYVQDQWYGTAFHLGEGVWVTADHICEDIIDSVKIEEADATLVRRGNWTDGGEDLCLLSGPEPASYLPLGVEPAFGERLVYVGYPEGHLGVYEGIYSGIDAQTAEPMFTAFAWGGASGSPVLSVDGRVVGVLVSGFRGRPYTYFEPVADLVRFIQSE